MNYSRRLFGKSLSALRNPQRTRRRIGWIGPGLIVVLALTHLTELIQSGFRVPLLDGLQIVALGGLGLSWVVIVKLYSDRERYLVSAYQHEIESVRRQMRTSDTIDRATGLYTYPYFHSRLDEEISRAKRYQHHLTVVVVSLTEFNKLTQRHGRLMGDAILRRFAAGVLRRLLRNTDIVARYGGEEFIAMLVETPKDGAQMAVKRLQEAALRGIMLPTGERVSLPITVGVATYPDDGSSADSLVGVADQDLRRTKSQIAAS